MKKKNPQKAIPKGTLLSIGITSLIYLLVAWIFGAVFVREASGDCYILIDKNLKWIINSINS